MTGPACRASHAGTQALLRAGMQIALDTSLFRWLAIHSHSIINRPSKPAWLKDLAVIDMGLYRRFYRQKRTSFAGAGDGAICGAATLSTPWSTSAEDTGERAFCQPATNWTNDCRRVAHNLSRARQRLRHRIRLMSVDLRGK
jgi:hypothetical protein